MAETIGMPKLGKDFFLNGKDILCYSNGRTHIYRSGSIGPILEEGQKSAQEVLALAKALKMQAQSWEGWVSYKGEVIQI